ncbi:MULTISPECIES: hypothetical protein [Acidobacterium]|uniref:Uncharacterized protein n=1 Tax=Acidobacterium capsulatum (strain ATCC 51196 / DSM 11244 / BCRC 80197 / JCM 7670 / NBRC 15755 / NCIMB 13165 / 161) TaxID=240015 RepID=C1FA31_ACIC5|nr:MULTISPECIES: hypothetical protein [Acidobacterium]ACO33199.1 hypothetical protein ACP_0412 [Acidobacterium capsulatum ATCC 51196]HCT62045.1 hypothetical protein [Acidobacterium sp.]
MPIELNANRVIVIHDRKHSYKLEFAKITRPMWERYFGRIVHLTEYQKGKSVTSFDSSGARVALVEEAILSAEGYASSGEDLASIAGWKSLLPISHRLTAGNSLTSVAPVQDDEGDDDSPLALGVESVTLRAIWTADEDGQMVMQEGLKHHFRTPTHEQQRRYSRDSARSRVVSNSRSSKTEWLGAQATLMALYDELIERVEGYTVNGSEDLSKETIAEFMDGYHKVAAMESIFSPAQVRVDQDETQEQD